MITFRITTDIKDDHRILLTLPPEVPTGRAELVVTVERPAPDNEHPMTSLADWAEVETGRDGKDQARYPLHGSVVRYDQPREPVADADWEAAR
jgi:hypothetical protein